MERIPLSESLQHLGNYWILTIYNGWLVGRWDKKREAFYVADPELAFVHGKHIVSMDKEMLTVPDPQNH